ncbi:MAG TPA: SpoIIE family protein phosphatase [Candidatus Acidoferrales bacterium]|nr:SpoIIE family protein phosphatase [Candidatus Acidoferrales bacterium]
MDEQKQKTIDAIGPEALSLMAEVSQEINASLDLDQVLAKIAAFVKRVIDYEVFAILLVDEARGDLYFRFAIGHRPEVVQNWRVPLGQGITGWVAANRKAIRVGDVSLDPRYINALDSVRSELAVPLLFKGHCVGVLDIQSHELNGFTREEQSLLSLLASRLALAIENARLFERTRRQADTLLLLHKVTRQASELLDLQELLRRAAELVKQVIDYEIFSILLYDSGERAFRHSISVKFGKNVQEQFVVPAGQGIVGLAAESRQPIVVPDVTQNQHYIRLNPETRSEMAVPLIVKNRVVGVMDLQSPQLDYFTPDHAQALSILAAHLAVAIENSRLYETVSHDEARMERDLQAARVIQGALLPEIPREDYGLELAARYVSAREVGGDIYDFRRYGPQELAIALGDVSGKGTAAALYGAVAIGILRSLIPSKPAPAAMLGAMNHLLGERHIEGRFMTLCFATWHRGRRKLRVANAGQSQPLVLHAGHAHRLRLTGFPLGMGLGLDDSPYEEASLELAPGDIVVFYSDGIVETMTADGRQFGSERLERLVREFGPGEPVHKLADRILGEIDQFSGGAPPGDDRTLLILRVK